MLQNNVDNLQNSLGKVLFAFVEAFPKMYNFQRFLNIITEKVYLPFVLLINRLLNNFVTLSLKYRNCVNKLQTVLYSKCFANCQHCFAKYVNQIHECSS